MIILFSHLPNCICVFVFVCVCVYVKGIQVFSKARNSKARVIIPEVIDTSGVESPAICVVNGALTLNESAKLQWFFPNPANS